MEEEAKKFIKNILKEKQITYSQLSKAMEKQGYIYNENSLRSKINRGAFSLAFLLEVCESLDVRLRYQ